MSDDNTLDEFSQTQELMNEHISKNRKEIRYSHSVSHSTGKTQETTPSCYAKRVHDHILAYFMMSIRQVLFDTVHK